MYNLSMYFLYKVTCTRIWQQSMSVRVEYRDEMGLSPRYILMILLSDSLIFVSKGYYCDIDVSLILLLFLRFPS